MRDPKTDPRHGDEFSRECSDGTWRYRVRYLGVHRGVDFVMCEISRNSVISAPGRRIKLSRWNLLAAGLTVEKVA